MNTDRLIRALFLGFIFNKVIVFDDQDRIILMLLVIFYEKFSMKNRLKNYLIIITSKVLIFLK